MATKAKETVSASNVVESVYTVDALIESYKVFGVNRDIVDVALRMSGKKTATFAEAKAIITKFKNREVK